MNYIRAITVVTGLVHAHVLIGKWLTACLHTVFQQRADGGSMNLALKIVGGARMQWHHSGWLDNVTLLHDSSGVVNMGAPWPVGVMY